MKAIFLFLVFIMPLEGSSEAPFPQEWIAPLLPITETPPLELSDSNREKVQVSPIEENRILLQSKALPWIYLLSATAIGALLLLLHYTHNKS